MATDTHGAGPSAGAEGDEPFAALSCSTRNIGDDIQALAAMQYLPPDVTFVDRDNLAGFRDTRPHRLILNGWFTHYPKRWPPAPSFRPLVTSIHFASDDLYGAASVAWLREQARIRPIGARDSGTATRMNALGIDAFHSGCLTMTLRASSTPARTGDPCVVDLPPEAAELMRRRVGNIQRPTNRISRPQKLFLTQPRRLRNAAALLHTYASSRLVVTRRLHAALPAMALGTPVLFVTDDPAKGRFSGLIEHMHAVSLKDFLGGRFDYDLANPPPNPAIWRPMADRLAASVTAYTGRPPRAFDLALTAVLDAPVRR